MDCDWFTNLNVLKATELYTFETGILHGMWTVSQ